MIDSSQLQNGLVTLGIIGGAALVMGWRRPRMRSWAYVVRIALGLLWIWGVLAVAVCQIYFARSGALPDWQFTQKVIPGGAIIGFLLVGVVVVGHIGQYAIERFRKPNKRMESAFFGARKK